MNEDKIGRDLQVPRQMTRLSDALGCLDKAVSELESRLVHVCRQETASAKADSDAPKEMLVDHAAAIEVAVGMVNKISTRVQSATTRLEL